MIIGCTPCLRTISALLQNKDPLSWASVHWLVECNATGMPLVGPVYTVIPLGDPGSTAWYTGAPLEKLSWNCPTLECNWTLYDYCDIAADIGTALEGLYQPPHTQAHIVKQSSIHASLKWQDDGTSSKWTGLCRFSFCLEYTALHYIPVLLSKRVEYFSITLCMPWIWAPLCFFVYLGLPYKWNQLSSKQLLSYQLYTKHKELHAGKWPAVMTSKPDALSTLGYHWTDCSGTTLAYASTQW